MLKDRMKREGNLITITKKIFRIKDDAVVCRCLHGKCPTPRCIVFPIDHVHRPRNQTQSEKAKPD